GCYERGVEQAPVLTRIDIGNMRGVAEIGLFVAGQIAIALLADHGQRIYRNEARMIPVLVEDLSDLAPERLLRQVRTGLDLPFIDRPAGADLIFDPSLRQVETEM